MLPALRFYRIAILNQLGVHLKSRISGFGLYSCSFTSLVLFHGLISVVLAVWNHKTGAVGALFVTADVAGNGVIIAT